MESQLHSDSLHDLWRVPRPRWSQGADLQAEGIGLGFCGGSCLEFQWFYPPSDCMSVPAARPSSLDPPPLPGGAAPTQLLLFLHCDLDCANPHAHLSVNSGASNKPGEEREREEECLGRSYLRESWMVVGGNRCPDSWPWVWAAGSHCS